MLNGTLSVSVWWLLGAGLILTQITIASVTIYLHRHQAHRALDLHRFASHFFRFWLWLTTGMITKEWVAVHRKHHARCDKAGDPHSPKIFGLAKVLLEGRELYVNEAEDRQTIENYGQGTPEDWLERNFYSRFPNLGVSLMLAGEIFLFGGFGLALWAVQMLWIPFWAAGVINGLGHARGYRNFETLDTSTNIIPIGLLIGGEELHNNHHAYPSSARLSARWWEFDIGWLYIRLLAACKLARVKRQAPNTKIDHSKLVADGDTLRAIIQNRFHVMALYGRKVMLPVLRLELHRADAATRKLLREIKPQLLRDPLFPEEGAGSVLKLALTDSSTLATVYQFKVQLRELWSNARLSQESKLEALHEWCRRAEETSIECLQLFAKGLQGYSIVQ
ncbi:MAG: DesA family fatty acid desaturase [Gammaproteobacteria bacterium]